VKRAAAFSGILAALAAFAYGWHVVGASGPALPLRLVADAPLTGNATRFDYASLDLANGTLWLAHMGDGSVEAFDTRRNRVRLTVPLGSGASVRGILAVDGRVYASSHSVLIYPIERAAFVGCQDNLRLLRLDLRSGKVVASGPAGIGVDVLALDPGLHRVYAASESGIVSVYDVRDGRFERIAQGLLHLNAHVVAVDPASHRVYFPLQNVGGKPVLRIMDAR
jgi:hypothetical protein